MIQILSTMVKGHQCKDHFFQNLKLGAKFVMMYNLPIVSQKKHMKGVFTLITCRNPSFGLATKAMGLQGCGKRKPGSQGKRKSTPTLGDGVPVDSRNFRERLQGSNLNALWSSLYH